MKLKSVTFRDTILIPRGQQAGFARANDRLTIELKGPLVQLTSTYGEPNVSTVVPVSNVVQMEPDEDEPKKAGK